MTRILFLILTVLTFATACNKPNVTKEPDETPQVVHCELIAPEDGAEIVIGPSEWIEIRGNGTVNKGNITDVILTIGDIKVPEVDFVPFSYRHDITRYEEERNIHIVLTLRGDEGTMASDSVNIFFRKDEAEEKEGLMIDDRDGAEYKTIQIGNQWWMAENLRYLPKQDFDISWNEPRYYIWFDYDLNDSNEVNSNIAKAALKMYGAFYNWHAAMDGENANAEKENLQVKGICPNGWHLPSQEEWNVLSDYIVQTGLTAKNADGSENPEAVAKAIATKGNDLLWILPPDLEEEPLPTWPGVEKEKNDVTGFNGIPIGFRACYGEDLWLQSAYSASWWSSTASSNIEGLYHPAKIWADNHLFITSAEFNPGVGLNVRCIKN